MEIAAMLGAVVVVWLCGWDISCYFPFLVTKRFYCVVKSPALCRLLISDRFFRSGMKTRPEDRNKMPLTGVLYWGASMALLVLIWASGLLRLCQCQNGLASLFPGLIGIVLVLSLLAKLFQQLDFWVGRRIHPAEAAAMDAGQPQLPGPAVKLAGGKNGICSAQVRKEVVTYLWAGPASLAGGALLVYVELASGTFWDGKNVLGKIVELILIACGAYLLWSGVKGLLLPESSTVCRSIRAQLHPEEKGQTAKEFLAMVDCDLAYAVSFAGGKVLIGQEWLYVRNSMGTPLIRLENIYRMEKAVRKDHSLTLSLKGPRDCGVCIPSVTSGDAEVLRLFLKEKARNLMG